MHEYIFFVNVPRSVSRLYIIRMSDIVATNKQIVICFGPTLLRYTYTSSESNVKERLTIRRSLTVFHPETILSSCRLRKITLYVCTWYYVIVAASRQQASRHRLSRAVIRFNARKASCDFQRILQLPRVVSFFTFGSCSPRHPLP